MHRLRLSMLLASLTLLAACSAESPPALVARAPSGWRADPAWDRGPAEWALYDATRVIYGAPRQYQATIWTNTEHVDAGSGVKARDAETRGAVRVFKHNLSEIIPTDRYDYRFLTTGHARVDDLSMLVLTMGSQEDCGASYRRFHALGSTVVVDDYCYFPGTGHRTARWTSAPEVRFHDLLSLTLRDFPFPAPGDAPIPPTPIRLVADQTTNLAPPLEPAPATIEYMGLERVDVPIGTVDAHHLIVRHDEIGGATESHYWMAADPALLHVMVRHTGPYGVEYRLSRLGWWAYWADDAPTERTDLGAP